MTTVYRPEPPHGRISHLNPAWFFSSAHPHLLALHFFVYSSCLRFLLCSRLLFLASAAGLKGESKSSQNMLKWDEKSEGCLWKGSFVSVTR